jgi:hypothetical protein
MKKRCYNPKASNYKDYGGRGITICPRWRESFVAFLEDMGPRPSDKHSIDRIDNNGPYCPENCRWATLQQQRNNRRPVTNITFQGETLSLLQWARRLNMNYDTLRYRIKRKNWPVEIAMTTPTDKRYSRQHHPTV